MDTKKTKDDVLAVARHIAAFGDFNFHEDDYRYSLSADGKIHFFTFITPDIRLVIAPTGVKIVCISVNEQYFQLVYLVRDVDWSYVVANALEF